jgi:hypothetical protein
VVERFDEHGEVERIRREDQLLRVLVGDLSPGGEDLGGPFALVVRLTSAAKERR